MCANSLEIIFQLQSNSLRWQDHHSTCGEVVLLTLGRVPATSEFFTKVLASCRDPLPSCQSQGPPPPESPLDRPRLDWDPHLCQVHSQFYKAVPAFRLNEPILLSSCPAEAQCCAWRVVDVPHIGMGWIRPCQQPILWASAAPAVSHQIPSVDLCKSCDAHTFFSWNTLLLKRI